MGKKLTAPKAKKPKAKRKTAKPTVESAKKAAGTVLGRMGDNATFKRKDTEPYLLRVLTVKNEMREASKGASEDIGTIVGEMAIALNIPKAAARAAANDFVADVRREERQTRREETNPDTALAYARVMASLGDDTPMGRWAKEKAGELAKEGAEEQAEDGEADSETVERVPPTPPEAPTPAKIH